MELQAWWIAVLIAYTCAQSVANLTADFHWTSADLTNVGIDVRSPG